MSEKIELGDEMKRVGRAGGGKMTGSLAKLALFLA